MKGTRVPDGDIDLVHGRPGDYGRNDDGGWRALTPNGRPANLDNHAVIQHIDGTITVTPSILVYAGKTVDDDYQPIDLPQWHGFLGHGVWREC